ncbi:mechanosensitive ion channel family protein [Desulfolithobacter dissulfuricans]|uniref:mechanosensitive ion channel family protein n=1 Tax=Desulfolithobacter dissulfuricans TaxID=2795293 RepID=UPI0022791CBF|nr:mechanosensitive ion channel family protein [Desulfolithobacter dissulfuricans]
MPSLRTASPLVIDKIFKQTLEESEYLVSRFRLQIHGIQHLPGELAKIWNKIEDGHAPGYPLQLTLTAFAIITTALLIEYLVRRLTGPFRNLIVTFDTCNLMQRSWCIFLRAVSECAFLLLFFFVSFILYFIFLPRTGLPYLFGGSIFKAVYLVRIIHLISTLLLAPRYSTLRILPVSDWTARFLSRWIFIGIILIAFLGRIGFLFKKTHADEAAFLALAGLFVLVTCTIFAAIILRSRKRVAEAIRRTELHAGNEAASPLILRTARTWYIPAMILIFLLAFVWEIRVLSTGKIYFGKVLLSSMLLPIFFAADHWGQKLFLFAFHRSCQQKSSPINRNRTEENGSQQSPDPRLTPDIFLVNYFPRLRTAYRLLLMALFTFLVLSIWDIDIVHAGQAFTQSLLLVITVLLIAYLIWHLFRSWIDTKIQLEIPEEDEEADEGGKGGSRRGTLLLLFRKAVLTLLFIITTMVVLTSVGVNIIPLLAGAGILGLAISFGAQSLITDIFSGLFFLIDDAFRLGDYVDCGGAKGTVEHISLRSLRLRHHRGMVHTIPFGQIATVTNYTRDYIIMKLDFRVRYDTDVEKVRKIIKRIYKDLLADPEFGPKLLGKLKSQGVYAMDDSAMIMRVKFTTRPGDQFVLRKEVYRRIQEAFREHGIEFAHRNVTVYVPPEVKNDLQNRSPEEKISKLGAAAAAAVIQGGEEQQQQKEDSR